MKLFKKVWFIWTFWKREVVEKRGRRKRYLIQWIWCFCFCQYNHRRMGHGFRFLLPLFSTTSLFSKFSYKSFLFPNFHNVLVEESSRRRFARFVHVKNWNFLFYCSNIPKSENAMLWRMLSRLETCIVYSCKWSVTLTKSMSENSLFWLEYLSVLCLKVAIYQFCRKQLPKLANLLMHSQCALSEPISSSRKPSIRTQSLLKKSLSISKYLYPFKRVYTSIRRNLFTKDDGNFPADLHKL
jgi:hypothetical protein